MTPPTALIIAGLLIVGVCASGYLVLALRWAMHQIWTDDQAEIVRRNRIGWW